MAFLSFAEKMKPLFASIINSHEQHAKWLNTLSYLENCGARKIAACEHPTLVKEEILKHAAEEFRHAHYLKQQIKKVYQVPMETYCLSLMLGGTKTLHYLTNLDLRASRYLKAAGFAKNALKEAAYLIVTYAIELRAEELYPLYHEALRQNGSRVTVKSILLEEKEHLKEMQEGLAKLAAGFLHADYICSIESQLFQTWIIAIKQSLIA